MFSELKVRIPEALREETGVIEREIEELIAMEEKRKLLSLFIDDAMKGAAQLPNRELVRLGRGIKKGRFEKLKLMGKL